MAVHSAGRIRGSGRDIGRVVLLLAAVALVLAELPVAAEDNEPVVLPGLLSEEGRIPDADLRPGSIGPTAEQQAIIDDFGATVRWNVLGNPQVLINYGGYIATGLDPDPANSADTARAWLRDHAALFRLTPAAIDDLELLQDSPLYDSPDQGWELDPDREGPTNADIAHVVRFRQHFEGIPAAQDGMVVVGIDRGNIAWVHATLSGDALNTSIPTLGPKAAYLEAAADVDVALTASQVRQEDHDGDWYTLRADGFDDPQRARLAALPTPADGVRLVWETIVLDGTPSQGHPLAFLHYVDAVDGRIWHRQNRVDHFAAPGVLGQNGDGDVDGGDEPNPQWVTFPAYPIPVEPPVEGDLVNPAASEDIRERWCWFPEHDEEGNDVCDRVVGVSNFPEFRNDASRAPWDWNPRTNEPTFTTTGNNADTGPSCVSFLTPDLCDWERPVALDRDYDFDWTNQWYEESCNPSAFTSPQRNDIDAATTALFVGHNRVHDWAYYLGFTERNSALQETNFGLTNPDAGQPAGRAMDPETGQSQAGYITGTVNPAFGRDNANQITLPDGIPGITNQYLWQPIGSAAYVPCVDGAYDMAVIAHEYGHAIQHRMTAGPETGLSGHQAGSMGESWSDLTALEYLNGLGLVPVTDENRYAVGAYVTGNKRRGVRNHEINDSPLNYSNVGYDFVGPGVHPDGEIWSAANFDIREALMAKYDDEFPADDQELQIRCAEGQLPAEICPGNRRWAQLWHDGFLLQPSATTMVDSRDAVLAADVLRFGGANQEELWQAFARRGLGAEAASPETEDSSAVNNTDPIPDFASPEADNAAVTFEPVAADGGAGPEDARIYVGEYEARSRPIADTDPETDLSDSASFAPDTYQFLVIAEGFAWVRFTTDITTDMTVEIPMQRNVASRHSGAEVTSWDGMNSNKLIDDSEETNWASLGSEGTASEEDDVEGRQVTVRLAGDEAQTVGRVQVSAFLRPTDADDPGDDPSEEPGPDEPPDGEPDDQNGDTEAQNRFSALRSFQILACNADTGADCDGAGDLLDTDEDPFEVIYTSPDDAFPSVPFRPTTMELTLRSFDVPETEATHVRFRVVTNQCTGVPQFQGDLDNDPTNNTDCRSEAGAGGLIDPQGENVRAAMLQVLGGPQPDVDDDRVDEPDPPPEPRDPDDPAEVTRMFGAGRVQTAVAVSLASFPDGADTVVMARSDLYPDALAGAPLAFSEEAPILVTPPDSLHGDVADEIDRLGASEAILLGGTEALSDDVEDAVAERDSVESVRRVWGPDRFDTAAEIADELGGEAVYVTEGRHPHPRRGWPDALAAAPIAAFQERPILLVEHGRLPDVTRDALDGMGTATVVGGEQAVSAEVFDEIDDVVDATDRVWGADRYETATAVAGVGETAGMASADTFAATGEEFVDALVAGPHVARVGGLFVLVHPETLDRSEAARAFLTERADTIHRLTIVGGPDAVSSTVEDELTALLNGEG